MELTNLEKRTTYLVNWFGDQWIIVYVTERGYLVHEGTRINFILHQNIKAIYELPKP